MNEQGPITWIEQRVAELEGNLAARKAETRSLLTSGTRQDPQVLARMESWEKELEGLKSLREIGADSRKV